MKSLYSEALISQIPIQFELIDYFRNIESYVYVLRAVKSLDLPDIRHISPFINKNKKKVSLQDNKSQKKTQINVALSVRADIISPFLCVPQPRLTHLPSPSVGTHRSHTWKPRRGYMYDTPCIFFENLGPPLGNPPLIGH